MSIRTRIVPAFLVLSFALVGCQHPPIIPAPGTDNTWQLITTYTIPVGRWHQVTPAMHVQLGNATADRPVLSVGSFVMPTNQIADTVSGKMNSCMPAAACQLVDSDRVHIGLADTIFWWARNHGPAASYDLDVVANTLGTGTDTSIARYWRAGEEFEVDVNWAANSYRIEGVLNGVRVGFVVADSLHLSEPARKLVRLVKLTKLPESGTVAQRDYTYLLLK